MRCDHCREAVSATLDDEDPGVAPSVVAGHLAHCAPCAAFADDLADLHRLVRVRAAEPVPDLSQAILAAAEPVAPRSTTAAARGWLRYGLVVIGLTLIALAVPTLLAEQGTSSIHLSRELGTFEFAFGAGLLFAAWQPERARGVLPMAAVLGGGLVLTAAIDVLQSRSTPLGESVHLLELAGVGLLALLARLDTTARVRRRIVMA